MTTNETPVTPAQTESEAPKRRRFPSFAKKTVDQTVTNETPAQRKGPHGVYLAGALLVAGGVGAAIASALGKSNPESTDSSDVTDVA